MSYAGMKPRSYCRTLAGKCYYQTKRYYTWYFSGVLYAQVIERPSAQYPHLVFHHTTPLYRPLPKAETWMLDNKIKNLELALQKLNGLIFRPGEVFSFWRLVGRPTKRKGYKPGMVLWEGKVIPGIGGGLCQLSNLIYWMTLHSPLVIAERYRHNYDVFPDADRTQPFGTGATVAYNYIDLQIKNPTRQAFQLRLSLNQSELIGEWWAEQAPLHTYEVYQKEHAIEYQYGCGYIRHNTIWRRIYNLDGELINDQPVSENHAIMMYTPVLPEGRE